MSRKLLRIGELAAELNTTTKTLRFYEQIGLLPAVTRSESGYRCYDVAAVERARLVLGLRRLGLTLDEVKALLADDGKVSLRQRLLALMDEKLREADLTLSVLQGRRDDLAARHQTLLSTPRARPPNCICDALLKPCHCHEGGGAKG